MVSALDKSLQAAASQIPECVAAGYVDMATGMLLAVNTVDSHPQEVLDMVSAATADLFQGSNVVAIENMFKRSRGIKNDNSIANLELWVKPQPSGIRAKEALAWARETVKTYAPLEDKL